VTEIPDAGEDHGDACLVASRNDLGITLGATGLDNRFHSGSYRLLNTIRHWEECIGRQDS
jgi:hypothetical protein